MRRVREAVPLLLCAALVGAAPASENQTRGVGVYPGDPGQDFAPTLVRDDSTYRNLALRRPAFHSSSYDYNLTAQLVTDGVVETRLPRWLATRTSRSGLLAKNERELLVDHNVVTAVELDGPSRWVQFELAGGDDALEIDRVEVDMRPRRPAPWEPRAAQAGPARGSDWSIAVSASDDGESWRELGRANGAIEAPPPPPKGGDFSAGLAWFRRANPVLTPSVAFPQPSRSRFYRVALEATGSVPWAISEVSFFDGGARVEIGGPYRFSSAWMSAGTGEEWVSVDLGPGCSFDRVTLHWLRRAAEGSLQASDDARHWRDLQPLPQGSGLDDEIRLAQPTVARYLRVLMQRTAGPGPYVLSELEVYGRGGPAPRSKPAPAPRADGRLELAGGAWRLQRDSLVSADGAALSRPGFADGAWLVATVPATVLSSYWNAGALPDPDFGDNQLMISDSFFYADFWYRTEFSTQPPPAGRHAFLHFDGVNWKAEVFLNGERLGRIEGAFTRGRFDVSGRLKAGRNALAVRIEKNATPGSAKQKTLESAGQNGGALGADNPTYHASIGWDWIPTVRGRNIGIWNDVYLASSGPATIEEPAVRTTLPLPDTSSADVRIEVALQNHETRPLSATLRGHFGEAAFEQPVTLAASSRQTVVLDPATQPALRLQKPRLWWPNGYGEPSLYDVRLELLAGGQVSDVKSFKAGVRQFTYDEQGGALRIFVNGRRFVGRGGNWGFPETNLRYRAREYDAAVRYHRDMNFTMIRNWVGQTGDDEFFEACDRHGIVVWQDFWLANPFDGPDPADEDLFLRNARDFVLRVRSHPSLGLYCGRNEGNPPPGLESGLRALVSELHGDLRYIPNSAFGPVSGGGPYGVRSARYYFRERATPKLHSELGMPNIPTFDSLKRMMPEPALWPPALDWGLHDFNLASAQRLSDFQKIVENGYGGANDAEGWTRLAQFVNYDGYRAMFEAQGRNRMGVLLWMSHPAWPSFVWQTYDYYLDPTAGYFGSKKGSEPLHVQWNAATDDVEVVNYSAGPRSGLTVEAEILGLDGARRWQRTAEVDSPEDSRQAPFKLEFPEGLTPVHFVRLRLTKAGETLSENFYWRGTTEGDFTALRTLPKVALQATTRSDARGDRVLLTTQIDNPSPQPALMVRLTAVRERSGDRILPALYSDNYVSLMPGEQRTIRTELARADARGEAPRIVLSGFNVE